MALDSHGFDDFARKMAANTSRRSVLRGFVGGAAALAGLRAAGATAAADKTWICHDTGSATNPFVYTEVANSSLQAHYAHGDFDYVDCCNDSDCDGGTCERGTCTGGCAPFTTLREGTCVNPCDETECHCITDPQYKGFCVATVSGDAICVPTDVVEKGGGECDSDEKCRDAGSQCVDTPFTGEAAGVCLVIDPTYCTL